MKTGTLVALSAGAVILGLVGVATVSYIDAYNTGNRLERSLEATRENNRNILAQYGLRIAEMSQVAEMQKNDLVEVVTAAIEGRYGEDGSQAVFSWIQEQNPSMSSEVYVQIQRAVESGRKDFERGQTTLLDVRRTYETNLGSFWGGTWMSIAGYPKVNLADFDVVSSARANVAFDAKEDSPINLRP